jgi:hypothetical protein
MAHGGMGLIERRLRNPTRPNYRGKQLVMQRRSRTSKTQAINRLTFHGYKRIERWGPRPAPNVACGPPAATLGIPPLPV